MFGFKKRKFKKLDYVYFGLVDIHTERLLVLDTSYQNISILKVLTQDTVLVSIPTRNWIEKIMYSVLKNETFHYMKWNVSSLTLELSLKGREESRDKSALLTAKYRTLGLIIGGIETLRHRAYKGIFLQDVIYSEKAHEAQRFIDRGCPEHQIHEYPYILQYADYANISLKEAADRVLLKSRMYFEALAKTESLRIKYFNAIREIEGRDQLRKLHRDFLLDYDIKI